jgi:mannose-1-phosphate guanylyltransferase
VQAFVEKPSPEAAADLLATGGVWSTMIIVAELNTLYGLYAAHLPALSDVFRQARAVPADLREAFLADRYPQLPHTDFSRDLLAPAAGLSLYVWPRELGWTDLGTPDRLAAWLRGRPSKPPALRGTLPTVAHVELVS